MKEVIAAFDALAADLTRTLNKTTRIRSILNRAFEEDRDLTDSERAEVLAKAQAEVRSPSAPSSRGAIKLVKSGG